MGRLPDVKAEMVIEDYNKGKLLLFITMEQAKEMFKHLTISTECWHRTNTGLPVNMTINQKKSSPVDSSKK